MSNELNSLWDYCQLEGEALDDKLDQLLGTRGLHYSTDWEHGGPLIEEHQIFLDPPHEVHRNLGPGADGVTRGDWVRHNLWTATVSANVRTKTNPHDPLLPRWVGRGAGTTRSSLRAERSSTASSKSLFTV